MKQKYMYQLKIKWSTGYIETVEFENREAAYAWWKNTLSAARAYGVNGEIIDQDWFAANKELDD